MRVAAFAAIALALLTAAALAPTAEPAAPALALTGGRVIDGTGREPIAPATVVIEGERILAVGPADSVVIPAGARTIDVKGKTVLPGFVDAHVHLTFTHIGRGDRTRWVVEGVTTVCDLAAPLDQMQSLKQPAAGEPRTVVAGPIVSVPGGYPGSHWGPGIHLSVRNPTDAKVQVRALLDRGADVIKLALERSGSRNLPVLSDAQIRAIVATAHARGVPVLAHVDTAASLERAVNGGVDTAAHMIRDRLPDALIRKMAARGVRLIPTLAVLADGNERRDLMLDNLRRFVAGGGKVALGDDWGNPGTSTGMPWYELRLYEQAGLSPLQIIEAATAQSAHACNRDRDLGTLEAGKLADLFVVAGNPAEDLDALRNVALVLKGGRLVLRHEAR
jgi:imidazolonepropionase-like amidohydrolase